MGTLSDRTLSLLLAADGDTSTAEWCRWAEGGGGEGSTGNSQGESGSAQLDSHSHAGRHTTHTRTHAHHVILTRHSLKIRMKGSIPTDTPMLTHSLFRLFRLLCLHFLWSLILTLHLIRYIAHAYTPGWVGAES